MISFLENLIEIPSITGEESEVLSFLSDAFLSFGWQIEKQHISENRYNIFVPFGIPEVCFTTHIDVVPGIRSLFTPRVEDGKVFGRGACDAKGILVSMITSIRKLVEERNTNLALLVVVGEETDGIGAKTAAQELKGRGIQYIINGEPTEGRLITAHKGGIDFSITFEGSSCHSGYPEQGDDANKKLIKTSHAILQENYGSDPVLGNATVNLGMIKGGTASNIVSDFAELHGKIRVVNDLDSVLSKLQDVVKDHGTLTISSKTPKVTLTTLPGFPQASVSYATDIPYFHSLNAKYLLYGPGSIQQAHTDDEWVEIAALEDAVEGYCRLYYELKRS